MDVLRGDGTSASKIYALGQWSDIFGLRKFSSHSRCELRWSLQNLQLLTIQVQIFSRIMSSRFFIYNVNLHEHFSQTNDANIPRNKNQYLRSWRKCSQCLSSMHRLCLIIIIFLFPLHWDFFTSRDITFVVTSYWCYSRQTTLSAHTEWRGNAANVTDKHSAGWL